ncbi:hypothetical protein FWK35_00012059 [Aphis craccivora]|uniref:Uncharacterized protein n=1 Tax=Aphis craccivora TaxID=307492 RepID=A0A6G0Z1Q9_APHCR|nr:hypothetical protein FWK35_00012059 [Aphis craccivora]
MHSEIEDDYYSQTKRKPQKYFNMKNTVLYVIIILCTLINLSCTLKGQRRTMEEQKNIEDLNVILKDLRTVVNNIDKYGKKLNNSNVTMHDVNSMATMKIAYDLIYTTLKKIFNKGAAPSNYSNSINGTQNHQTIINNGSQILNYNITIVNSKKKKNNSDETQTSASK